MKEAYGGTFLFNIVILFLLLFTGIMCLTINRSKAFAVKDSIITAIEEAEGIDLTGTKDEGIEVKDIADILNSHGYRTKGSCLDKYQGYSYDGERTLSSENPSFCIKQVDKTKNDGFNNSDGEAGYYYSVMVFYNLDLPILKSFFNFSITGETITMYDKEFAGV